MRIIKKGNLVLYSCGHVLLSNCILDAEGEAVSVEDMAAIRLAMEPVVSAEKCLVCKAVEDGEGGEADEVYE